MLHMEKVRHSLLSLGQVAVNGQASIETSLCILCANILSYGLQLLAI